jgi:hypothetical protein
MNSLPKPRKNNNHIDFFSWDSQEPSAEILALFDGITLDDDSAGSGVIFYVDILDVNAPTPRFFAEAV